MLSGNKHFLFWMNTLFVDLHLNQGDHKNYLQTLFEKVRNPIGKLPAIGSWESQTKFVELHLYLGNRKTYLQRQLKMKAMTTFYDIRGVRRLSLLCDCVAKVELMITNDE